MAWAPFAVEMRSSRGWMASGFVWLEPPLPARRVLPRAVLGPYIILNFYYCYLYWNLVFSSINVETFQENKLLFFLIVCYTSTSSLYSDTFIRQCLTNFAHFKFDVIDFSRVLRVLALAWFMMFHNTHDASFFKLYEQQKNQSLHASSAAATLGFYHAVIVRGRLLMKYIPISNAGAQDVNSSSILGKSS